MKGLAEKITGNSDPEAALNGIYRAYLDEKEDRATVVAELVALHNAGTIDLVEIYSHLKNTVGAAHDFFLTRHVIEQALPHLEAPTERVMHCVLHLYQQAGRDMAAGHIFGSFKSYCQKNAARVSEALQIIEAAVPELLDLLPPVLAAGAEHDAALYQAHCMRLCADDRLEVRQTATFALGVIRCAQPEKALEALHAVLEASSDDQLLGNVVRSAFKVAQKHAELHRKAGTLIDRTLHKGGEQALHAAADLYWLHSKELGEAEPILCVLRGHIPRVSLKNSGTLDSLDHGFAQHLKTDAGRTIPVLENTLLGLGGNAFAAHFDSTTHQLREDNVLLGKLMTRWFLRGDPALCKAIHHVVVSKAHGEKLLLAVDPAEVVPNDPVHVLFLARKAIGYLLMHPVAAASVLVSIMRLAPDEALPKLARLLFDPLLLNFPDVREDYLVAQAPAESSKVQAALSAAMEALESYLERLRAIGTIHELHPSDTQRRAHSRHFGRLVSESFKQAQKESVFMQLVSRSVLLYGRSSISHVYAGDGTPHRTEIPLSPHSVTIDVPRLENLDPLGMDYRLRAFRQEQFRK